MTVFPCELQIEDLLFGMSLTFKRSRDSESSGSGGVSGGVPLISLSTLRGGTLSVTKERIMVGPRKSSQGTSRYDGIVTGRSRIVLGLPTAFLLELRR